MPKVYEDKDGQRHQPVPGGRFEKRLVEQGAKVVADTEAPEEATDESGVPTESDSKKAWVDFAVEQGFDRTDVEAMSKTALIEMLTGSDRPG